MLPPYLFHIFFINNLQTADKWLKLQAARTINDRMAIPISDALKAICLELLDFSTPIGPHKVQNIFMYMESLALSREEPD